MKKITLILTALVASVVIFSSCKGEPKKETPKADTFMSVAISLPNSTFTRAESEKKTIDPKLYAGLNQIDRINVFIVDQNSVTSEELTESDFTVGQANGQKVVKLTAKKAIPTKSGEKHVYVLINGTNEIVNMLNATPSLTAFDQKYKAAVDFSADIANMMDSGNKSKVVMANSTKQNNGVITVQPGIDESTALAGTNNKVTVEVERVAAVAVVTKVAEIKVAKSAEKKESQYKVEKLTYAAGLVEANFFLTQKKNNGEFESPNFNFMPTKTDFTTDGVKGKLLVNDLTNNDREVMEVMSSRDVDGIGNFTFQNKNVFLSEMSRSKYVAGNTTYILVRAYLRPSDKMFADGTKQSEYTSDLGTVTAEQIIADRADKQEFVLYQDDNKSDVKTTASKIQREYTYQSNGTFWVAGEGTKEGSVYASYANSQNPKKNGVFGQKVRPYIAGKALYTVYPNPDVVADGYQGATKFPVERNDIYHINITRFTQIGKNWNNRYPTPSPGGDGDGDETPGGNDKNPDPSPDEDDNEVEDPQNPVIPKKTYLAVDIDILPWEVYSHDIVL